MTRNNRFYWLCVLIQSNNVLQIWPYYIRPWRHAVFLTLHVPNCFKERYKIVPHSIHWPIHSIPQSLQWRHMSAMASRITSLTIVYSTVYSGADQRKHQSSASLASVQGIHRWPVNSQHKGPVTRKMFPFDDVIMKSIPWLLRKKRNSNPRQWTHIHWYWNNLAQIFWPY